MTERADQDSILGPPEATDRTGQFLWARGSTEQSIVSCERQSSDAS
jgi:hypothetical protein